MEQGLPTKTKELYHAQGMGVMLATSVAFSRDYRTRLEDVS